MQKFRNLAIGLIVALGLTVLLPVASQAAYPDPPQGSGYPFTRIVTGQVAKESCPTGFQHANGLIVDLSWPRGQREFTECWPEAAFIANRIGGSTWQAFKDSGGTLSVDELYAIQQAWRDYYQEIEDAQDAAAEESRRWNEAHPGQQKCVQWGPIVAPDGVGQSSGGVCANPVSAPAEPSASPTASPEVPEDSSASSEATSSPTPEPEPEPDPAPEPPPAPTGLGGYAVVHPITGHVCGVIVGNGLGSETISQDYMGCPAGSKKIFQTKPSPSGNVAGYHGRDVLYKNGRFYLASGTYLENGLGYDPDGRVWDTGSGETIRAATKVESPSTPVSSSPSSSPSTSSSSDSVSSDGSGSSPSPAPADDTYERICKTMGWYECATWRILDANGVQKNRVVGPYPKSEVLKTCGSNLCGGGPGGSVEFIAFVAGSPSAAGSSDDSEAPSSPEPEESATSSDEVNSGETTLDVSSDVSGIYLTVGNAIGKKISVKLGGKWYVLEPTRNSITRAWYPGTSEFLQIMVYVDRVLKLDSYVKTTGSSANSDESTSAVSDQTATQSPSAPGEDEKVAIATPTNLKVTSDENAVYLTVENGKNKKVSVKFAGKWSVFTPSSDVVTEAFYPQTTGFVSMAVYVDGVIKLNTFVQRNSAAASDAAQNEQAAAPDGAKGNGYPFTRMVIGQVGVSGCPSGFNYATGLIVDVGANQTYTECWPEAAFIANRLGGDVWQAFKASNGATSVESLRKAWADRNGTGSTVDSTPTSSEVVDASPTESQKVTVSPSVALKTTENSVKVEVSNGIGSRLSAKIAGNWYVVEIDKALEIVEKQVQPGVEVSVAVYLDRALILRESVTAGIAEAVTEVPVETEQSPPDRTSTSSQSQSASSTAPASTSASVSVEVGSNGSDIAFSVLNGQGKKISVKVGGRWIVQVPTSQNYVFTTSSIQGQDVEIRIYVEGELTGASTITVGDPTQTSFVQEVSTESPSSGPSSDNTSSPVTEATTSPAVNFEAAVASSNSEIVVSLSGAEGQKVSLKVGGRWFVVYPSNSQEEFRTASIAGETVAIDVYLNAVFWGSLTTIVQD